MQENEIYEMAEVVEENDPIISEEADVEVIEVEMTEGFQSPTMTEAQNHALLTNREISDAHPITAITGLREELNSIEALQTIYSDKMGTANYYEWTEGCEFGEDAIGRFVTLKRDVRTIDICTGQNIFGVVVSGAGFVGGQDGITLDYVNGIVQNYGVARDARYGLVATSGAVLVRCESDVEEGNRVVCNSRGFATKSPSDFGYHISAIHNINGITFATVNLDLSADQINFIGNELHDLDSRVSINAQNIYQAINVANQAYNKAEEASNISSITEGIVNGIVENVVKKAEDLIENYEHIVENTSAVSAQAKAIAENAVLSADTIRKEAVDKAAESWDYVAALAKELEPIRTWEDPDGSGKSGADYLAEQMKDGIATTVDIKTVITKTEEAMSSITRSGKELQSLMTVINKYSVGEYSQANGLTFDQAQNILEIGMIYVPTSHEKLEAGTREHEEIYPYTDKNGQPQAYKRKFIPGYLYQWGKLANGSCGWITIDKDFAETTETEGDATDVINTSSMSVFFSTIEILVGKRNRYGYWYTNGDEIVDINGNVGTYEPYTLYKWEVPENQDGYWFAVATLSGNVQNRVSSVVRQTANEIASEIINARGSLSGFGAWLSETESKVQSTASWVKGKDGDGNALYNLATMDISADGDGSRMALVVADQSGNTTLGGASIVLNQDSGGSFIQMDADHINFESDEFTIGAGHIDFTTGDFTVNADAINFKVGDFEINADNLDFGKNVIVSGTGDDVLNVADNFIVDRRGNVRLNGNITWGTGVSPVQVLYHSNGDTKPENGKQWSKFPEYTVAGWHQTFKGGADYYGSYTYDGGETWGDPVQIVGKPGTPGTQGEQGIPGATPEVKDGYWYIGGQSTGVKAEGSDASVTDINVFKALTNGSKLYGCFTSNVGDDGIKKLYINAAYIQAGTIGADLIFTGRIDTNNLQATGGSIGGWDVIQDDTLRSRDANVGMSSGTYDGSTSFWAGGKYYNAPFRVTAQGKLYASDVEIKGNVEIGVGGSVGGWNVMDHGISKDGTGMLSDGDLRFYSGASEGRTVEDFVVPDVTVTSEPGYYEFTIPNAVCIYSVSASIDFPTGSNMGGVVTVTTPLPISGNTFTYKCESALGNWGIGTVRLRCDYESEVRQPEFAVYSDGSLRALNIEVPNGTVRTFTEDETRNPTYAEVGGYDGVKLANRSFIENEDGGYTTEEGKVGYWSDCYTKYSAHAIKFGWNDGIGDDISNELKTTYTHHVNYIPSPGSTSFVRFDSEDGEYVFNAKVKFLKTVYNDNNIAIHNSYRESKYDIENLSDKYSVLFDNLNPVRFKYKKGESGRYHSGFILDEVKTAMDIAGIDTSEFAAYCIEDEQTGKGGLRYGEFTSLNTYEIQKLKARTIELETKVIELEAKLNEITTN